MPDRLSRREVLGTAAIGLAASALPAAVGQTGKDREVDAIDKELAKPLSPEARKLLVESLKGLEQASKDRLKTKLPENSEPCFSYFPSTREVRSK